MSTDIDLAIALSLSEGRTSNFVDTRRDSSIARSIQDEDIAQWQSTLGEKTSGFGTILEGSHSQQEVDIPWE